MFFLLLIPVASQSPHLMTAQYILYRRGFKPPLLKLFNDQDTAMASAVQSRKYMLQFFCDTQVKKKKSRFITSFYKSLHFSPLSETSWYSQKYSPTKERICYLANWRTLSQTKNYWELSCLSKTIYHHQTQILTFWNENHSYTLAKPIPSVTTHEYAAYLFTFSCPYW